MSLRIGIDVGGVLVEYGRGSTDGPLINVDNAIDVLQEWKEKGYELYIISYCKESHAIRRTNRFITDGHSHFFKYEYYVEERFFKGDVIKNLDLDVMIDDNQALLYDIKMKNPKITTILYQEFNKQIHTRDKHNQLANEWFDVKKIVEEVHEKKKKIIEKDPFSTPIVVEEKEFSESFKDNYEIHTIHEKAIFIQ